MVSYKGANIYNLKSGWQTKNGVEQTDYQNVNSLKNRYYYWSYRYWQNYLYLMSLKKGLSFDYLINTLTILNYQTNKIN